MFTVNEIIRSMRGERKKKYFIKRTAPYPIFYDPNSVIFLEAWTQIRLDSTRVHDTECNISPDKLTGRGGKGVDFIYLSTPSLKNVFSVVSTDILIHIMLT